jgi:predicted transcriptional regulator
VDEEEGYFDSEGRFVVASLPVKKPRTTTATKEEKPLEKRESAIQTDDFEEYLKSISKPSVESESSDDEQTEQPVTMTDVKVKEDIDPERLVVMRKQKIFDINERPASPEVEDVDPKFLKKPEKMMSVAEGEPVKFEVQVAGTEPIGKFKVKVVSF